MGLNAYYLVPGGYSMFVPLSIRYTIHNTARFLQELGGPYLEASALKILQEVVSIWKYMCMCVGVCMFVSV